MQTFSIRDRLQAASSLTFGLVLVVSAGGCRVPRTHTAATSPDGRYTAFVRQGFAIDPPDDHLYVATRGHAPRYLMRLAPDADWCQTILWTSDSRQVAFLVRDQQLAVFDAATAEHVAMVVLVHADGYPGSQGARDVTLGTDGHITFERFERATNRSLGREATAIPHERLSLRINWADSGDAVKDAWVRVRLTDGREVRVHVAAGADGVVRLPAVDGGPLASVEVRVQGVATAILEHVPIAREPIAVRLGRLKG